jgi:beta-lactamase class D
MAEQSSHRAPLMRPSGQGLPGNPGSRPLVNLNDVTWMWVNNQWVLATSQGWTLVSAERINRAGWIVGYGTKAGQSRAFVLSPR